MAHYRTVHVNGEAWRYHIGAWYIPIRGPRGECALPTQSDITGWDPYALERAAWKGPAVKIKPQMIKDFILRYILVAKAPDGSVPTVHEDHRDLTNSATDRILGR